ncbi:hypothetical protein DSC45_23680 [Streptomyces sp. YIM 130001]|uniref:hypothetical protein n=1 Tax=Streptomyces sp. YIM 130001 TaxID=2259644 RepID=UPI000EB94265|nr:hypothetical protein [Streptomyces sp. YIM 130001]RII13354.1 hypothetical protein DSC45_23680 [Streptomyces sp. YIM 130001]
MTTRDRPSIARRHATELKKVPKCANCRALILWENPAESCQFCEQSTRTASGAVVYAEIIGDPLPPLRATRPGQP